MAQTVQPVPLQPTFVGFGRELTRGTGVAAATFVPVLAGIQSPGDKYNYVDDVAWRGSAVESVGTTATQAWAEPTWQGPAYVDTIGNLLLAILGEVSSSGTANGTFSSTLSATTVAGATTFTTAAQPANGAVLMIDVGNKREIRVVSTTSGAGPYTVNFVPQGGLLFPHTSGVAVVSVDTATNPYTHAFNVNNTAPFQPPSQTLVDYNGFNARQIPGFVADSLTIKFTATGLVEYTVKGKGFKSSTVTKPTQSFSAETIKPAWIGTTTLGGSASSVLSDGEIVIARNVDPVPTIANTQDPASIFTGGNLMVTGKLNTVYIDDTQLSNYTGTTSTSIDLDFLTGAGAAVKEMKFHMSNVFYKNAVPVRSGKQFVELPIDFKAYGNTTDVGFSGGYSPLKVTLQTLATTY